MLEKWCMLNPNTHSHLVPFRGGTPPWSRSGLAVHAVGGGSMEDEPDRTPRRLKQHRKSCKRGSVRALRHRGVRWDAAGKNKRDSLTKQRNGARNTWRYQQSADGHPEGYGPDRLGPTSGQD